MASLRSAGLLSILLPAFALAGCSAKDRPAQRGDAPRDGGIAVVAINTELDYPNPLLTGDKWAQEVNRFLLFLPLLQYGPKLEYQPALASSWDMLADTGVVFHLRRDVKWTDGQPTNAQDVVFTLQRALDPKTGFPNAEWFQYYKGVDALNDSTVRVRFRPQDDPLAGLPLMPIVPRHLLDTVPVEKLRQAAFNQHPVGNGPFKLVEHKQNDRWVFDANPDYPAALGRPHLSRIVLRIVPEATAQVTAILTGEADMITGAGAPGWKQLGGKPEIRRLERQTRGISIIAWNGRRPALRDPRVRLALSLAIDRRTILDALRGGLGELAIGPITPSHWAYDKDLQPLPYAPDSARALLAQAGWVDRNHDGIVEDARGRPLEITLKIPPTAFNQNMAEMVRAQLQRVGVSVKQQVEDVQLWRADLEAKNRPFDGSPISFETDQRLQFREQFHSQARDKPMQWAGYANPAVDSIIDAAPLTSDRQKATALWRRFQEIMAREQPWTFMYYFPDLVEVRSVLHGTDMDVRGALVNVTKWWRAPANDKVAQN
ncbi:MAG TPA: ABC transporter substrate-binding protein [Longimicrobiales bacterium]